MRIRWKRSFGRFLNDERGQALPILAFAMVSMLGMGGFVVDAGRLFAVHRDLQAATDAAALAGAYELPAADATTVATNYSAVAGGKNARPSLTGTTMVSGYPQVSCLATLTGQGIGCQTPSNANAIVVKQQKTVSMTFMRVLGMTTMNVVATATAAARGGTASMPYNVAILLDSSLSMNVKDSNCSNNTRMQCALNGVQELLKTLSPCAAAHATCTVSSGVAVDPVDQVALFTFPNVTVGTASINTNCTTPISAAQYQANRNNGGNYYNSSSYGYYDIYPANVWSGLATGTAYTYPSTTATSYAPTGSTTGTYQVTKYLSDYRASDTATTLTATSDIVQAAGGASGCGSLAPPNFDGSYGTYYAGAIYAAIASLKAQQAAYPASQGVIILLSDGDASAPQKNGQGYYSMQSPAGNSGTYPSYVNECQQGVTAAQAATNAGIRFYTVAYGAPTSSSSCSTDTGNSLTGCTAMSTMASTAANFYSDYNQSGASSSNCYSTNAVSSLNDIFVQISNDLTVSRLIPDGMN